jgi:hypothetical protein
VICSDVSLNRFEGAVPPSMLNVQTRRCAAHSRHRPNALRRHTHGDSES